MKENGELSIFCSSLILFMILVSVNSENANKVLAQPSSASSDLTVPFPSTSKSDVELIEDIINRQGQISEPQETEPEVQTRTDGSQDGSGSIVDSNKRNGDVDYDNDDKDEDAGRQKEVSLNEDRKDSQPSMGSGGVYVVDYMNIRIQKFDGDFITKWGSEGKGDGEFGVPHGITVDPSSGNVYVVYMNNCNVQIFDKEGNSYQSGVRKVRVMDNFCTLIA
jgi:hypothetical protein